MPLFQFSYGGKEFIFSEHYSLEKFDANRDIPDNVKSSLSSSDVSYLFQEDWALVATNPSDYFKSEVNMLLISLRIYAKSNAFIKWRFCEEDSRYSTCLNDRFRNLLSQADSDVTEETLYVVKNRFLEIMEMYSVSDRTKNALYFIWRGLCAEKHIDAYIFFVCALESLFSKETSEEGTKTIIKRIYKFLSEIKGFGGDQIKNIYKMRSDMVHGRISHTDKGNSGKRKNNLKNLGKLEELVFVCMNKILTEKTYLLYGNVDKKETFFNDLTKARVQ